MVIVVAAEIVTHAGTPTPLSFALAAMREYVDRIDGGALR